MSVNKILMKCEQVQNIELPSGELFKNLQSQQRSVLGPTMLNIVNLSLVTGTVTLVPQDCVVVLKVESVTHLTNNINTETFYVLSGLSLCLS